MRASTEKSTSRSRSAPRATRDPKLDAESNRPKASPSPTDLNVVYHRPWLYEAQRLAIFDGLDFKKNRARYAFIEASTKAGKTVGCLAWIIEQAMAGKPGWNYWWIAPVYGQAEIAYRRAKRGLTPGTFVSNTSKLFIRLINGTTIWFKSAEKPDNLYGEDVHAAVIDEASRMREESWNAIRTTLTATRGPVRIIGNVKGRRNWFYRLARRAEAGAVGMSYAKLTADDAVKSGVLDADEIADAKGVLPEAVFRELYYAEPSDDEGNPFGLKAIRACVAPMSEQGVVAIGVDLAKSVDWTVMIGLDREGYTCGFERWQSPWDITLGRIVALGGKYAPMLVDSTGVGDPIVEQLQSRRDNVLGYHFSAASKQRLMEGLAAAIQQGIVHFPEGPIRAELENFEYEYRPRGGIRYSAPEGYHDDCVVALALAVEMKRANVHTAIVPPAGETKRSVFLAPG